MKVSACVITKNEEKNLSTCLDSVKSIVSEIIVVDTGSTDRTVEIARSYGAKVFSFEWINDFAAARNYAIEQAKGDWIIFLDADEYFAPDSVKYVKRAILDAEKQKMDMIICLMAHLEKKTKKITSSNLLIRIFKRHPQIRYVGAIHERIVRLDRPAKLLNTEKNITIFHTGYSEETVNEKEKAKRNLNLLFAELEKKPDSSELLFYISESYLMEKQFEEALHYALLADQNRNSTLIGLYEKNYVNILWCFIHLSKPREELREMLMKAISEFPNYPDYYLFLGDYYKSENRYRDSIQAYETALKLLDQELIAETGAKANALKVIGTLGHLYCKLREWNQCVNYHVQALQIDKYYYSSLHNLMHVLGRFEKPDAVFSFFSKIYDVSSNKDKLYLLRAALDTNQQVIAQALIESFPAEHPALLDYHATFLFLTGNYEASFQAFLALYRQTKKEAHAYGAIAAAWMGRKQGAIAELERAFGAALELQQLTANIVGELSPISIDKTKLLEFLSYLGSKLHVTDSLTLFELAKRLNLLLEMGDCLYYLEKYADAFQFFNLYLEQKESVPEDKLADITFKAGDCLMQNGMDEQAWPFLQKALSLAPTDFRIYEASIELMKRSGSQTELKAICETAKNYFPDSNYIRTVLAEI